MLGGSVLHAIVHAVEGVEDGVVLGVSLVELLQTVEGCNGVSVVLQVGTDVVELSSQCVLSLCGVLLGNSDIAVAALEVLLLVGITAREQGYLSEELLLRLVVLSLEERVYT